MQQLAKDLRLAHDELQHRQPIIDQKEEPQQVPPLLEEEPDEDDELIKFLIYSLM